MNHPPGWAEARSGTLGASEIAAVLGISPWTSAYAVWQSKIAPHDSQPTERMRWGTILENVIIDEAARRLGVQITGRQVKVVHPAYPWASATLDATFADAPAGAAGLIEAKTTRDPAWAEVPDYYRAQVQWQLEITGYDDAWLPCLHAGQRLTLWHLTRDKDTGAALIRIGGAWWARHVIGREPPPLDGSAATAEAIGRLYPAIPELTADVAGVRHQISRLREIARLTAAMKAEAAGLRAEVQAALGHAETGVINGEVACTWRQSSRRTLDQKRLREEQPALADTYTRSTPVRTFRLAGEGDDDANE